MLAAGILTQAGSARAQNAWSHQLPAKNQHVFVPTTFIPDAFVNTELSLGLGYSNSLSTDIPIFGPGGQKQIGTVQGDLLFMTGGFEFDCALRDWIGFTARFDALARMGGNTASILATGLSAASRFGVGWEFRLAESDRSMFSASVEMNRTSVTAVDVATFVKEDQNLSRTVTPLFGSVQTRYARGLNDLVGISAAAGVGFGENPRDDYKSSWFWNVGGVASFNLSQRYSVPVGLALGLRTNSYPVSVDNASGNAWAGLLSLAYMGRPDFALTLDTVYERVPIDYNDVAIGYIGFTVGLTYCF
ncbi:MAG TPA: hypothetical protein VFH33_00395 [Candidatus Krumholzibacteria bacterium]|nr:hypothetical protein [Candidatus Krumholzibacteria bacterium]